MQRVGKCLKRKMSQKIKENEKKIKRVIWPILE